MAFVGVGKGVNSGVFVFVTGAAAVPCLCLARDVSVKGDPEWSYLREELL